MSQLFQAIYNFSPHLLTTTRIQWTPTGTHVHGQTATGHTRRQQTLNGIRGPVSVDCRPRTTELISWSQTQETFVIAAGCAGNGTPGATYCRGIWFRTMERSLQPLAGHESRLGE
jgi:hypothetical protein